MPMGLNTLLDNIDKGSKHTVMYDKQMHQITPKQVTQVRQVHRMTPKWPYTLKGRRYSHIHARPTPESQISLSFALRPAI